MSRARKGFSKEARLLLLRGRAARTIADRTRRQILSCLTGSPSGGHMPEASLSRPRGIWIALSTFVPTFLTVVFDIPHLAGLPMTTRSFVGGLGCPPPVLSSPAPGAPGRTIRVGGLADAGARLVSTPREALGNGAVPATASLRTTPPHEPKTAEPLPSAAAIMRDGAWARGPDFLQKESAAHFAARMERVGFPTHATRDARRGNPLGLVDWQSQYRLPRSGTPGASPTFLRIVSTSVIREHSHSRAIENRGRERTLVSQHGGGAFSPSQRVNHGFGTPGATTSEECSLFLDGYRQGACYQGPERWKSQGDEGGGIVCAGVTFTVLIAPRPGRFNTRTTRSPTRDDTSAARPGP